MWNRHGVKMPECLGQVRCAPRRSASLRTLFLLVFFSSSILSATTGWAYNFSNPPGLYHSYNDLSAWAYGLQSQNPNLVRVVQYGESYEHRPLLAINITTNPTVNDPNKPEFLFAGGIHAREVIGSEAALAIADNLVGGFRAGDATYLEMLSKRDVWIIPQQNPDARLQVEAGSSALRKNWHLYPGQSQTGTSRGVDLNRNYPHQWNLAPSSIYSEEYRGPEQLSEPESKSLWDFLGDANHTGEISNLLCSVDLHSGVKQIMSPWTYSGDPSPPLPPQDAEKFTFLKTNLNQITGLSIQPYGGMVYGTLADSIYETFGAYSLTVELHDGAFVGSYPDSYFSHFNPVDQVTRDAALKKAVDSALFLLSDRAFAVPEPSAFVYLVSGIVVLFGCFGRKRF